MREPGGNVQKAAALRRVRFLSGAVALVAVAVALAIQFSGGGTVRFVGLHISARDPFRTAIVALAATAFFLITTRLSSSSINNCPPRISRRDWALAAAVALVPLLILVAAIVKLFPDAYPSGDGASLSLHTIAAIHGSVYVGPYSKFGWNHPGPLLFYVMAPLYFLSGYHEMSVRVTALLINGAGALGMMLIARRFGGRSFLVLTVAAVVLIECRAGGDLAFSAWNPHVTVLPLAALLFIGAAVAAGAIWLFPLATLVASFLAQSHVGFVPVATLLTIVPLFLARRSTESRLFWRVVNLSAWLLLILWLLPISEQIVHRPGNLTAIGRYFVSAPGEPQSFAEALQVFSSYYLSPFLASHALPRGWPAVVTTSWLPPMAATVVGLAAFIAALASAREGSRFVAAFCGLCVATSVVAFVSVWRIRGPITDHQVFWLCVVGMLSLVGIGAVVVRRLRLPADRFRTSMCAAAWISAALLLGVSAVRLAGWWRAAAEQREILVLYQAMDDYMMRGSLKAALLRHTDSTWAETVGVVLQGAKHGRRITVAPGMVRLTGDAYATTGNENVQFVLFDYHEDREIAMEFEGHYIQRTPRFAIAVVEGKGPFARSRVQ